ncbi:MAG: hypothetical protein PHR64_00585 [Candidatus Shapirobacteria bacterium]|nr:hypothetical protein [Candidatus Shapirobacteria bacterium]MDD5073671.1 hypothetical protein [Candidatus Shapirobacteria bacterium]MDD5481433.1 hypothetical protein [Candidatus Shapirobacteria bacterium]
MFSLRFLFAKNNRVWLIILLIFFLLNIYVFYRYWQGRKNIVGNQNPSDESFSSEENQFCETSETENYAPGYREMGEYGAFAGTVIEKATSFFVISGGEETVRVNIVPETIFYLPLYDGENPGKILPRDKTPPLSIANIEVGDRVDVVFTKKTADVEYEGGLVLIDKKI